MADKFIKIVWVEGKHFLMAKSYRVAVASSDGIVVNQHFGHAETFYIYQIESNALIGVRQIRHMKAVCNLGEHDHDRLRENLQSLQDCDYLLVSKIGNGAASCAQQFGILPMELPGLITEALQKVIDYVQVQNLFERN